MARLSIAWLTLCLATIPPLALATFRRSSVLAKRRALEGELDVISETLLDLEVSRRATKVGGVIMAGDHDDSSDADRAVVAVQHAETPADTATTESQKPSQEVEKEVDKSVNETVSDAKDREIATAEAESEANGDAAINASNETAKSKIKVEVEKAITDGVESSPTGHTTEVNVSGSRNAGKEIKEKVNAAVGRTVRQIMHEKAKNQTGSKNASGNASSGSDQRSIEAQSGYGVPDAANGSHSMDSQKNLTGEKIVQEITKKVQEAIDRKVENVTKQHREPTEEELEDAAEEEIDRIWGILQHAQRLGHHEGYPTGFWGFFRSVQKLDWLVLVVTCAFALQRLFQASLATPARTVLGPGLANGLWLVLGIFYGVFIFLRQGKDDGVVWMNGYVLELIFMLENVFVFHVIVEAFDLTRPITKRALFVVLSCQIVIQMVFYMGLAGPLRGIAFLPYMLGAWLLYCGYLACAEVDSEGKHMDVRDTFVVRLLQGSCIGEQVLSADPDDAAKGFLVPPSQEGVNSTRLSMAGLATIALVLADFLLEIDVTVTKIEAMQNQYLSFSSSVIASFALPEVFFETRSLFRRYPSVKYGISFVLVFFGLQMLLHDVFLLSALHSVFISLSAITFSLLFSAYFDDDKMSGTSAFVEAVQHRSRPSAAARAV